MSGTFRHGIHPAEHKESTAQRRIERLPFPTHVTVPLRQHGGAPCAATVTRGERVERGAVIATPTGFVSTTHHAPVSGTVIEVGPRRHPSGSMETAIEIETDAGSPQLLQAWPTTDLQTLNLDDFINGVQAAGLVGLGGAAFPSHVKYRLPDGRRCQHLVINGCECEPYLTSDHRLMVEHADAVVAGSRLLARMLEADDATIGVELNKPDGIDALREAAARTAGETASPPVRIAPLEVKYPQGAEKMLIKAVFDQEVPAGKLPLDLGIVVNNVATMAALIDWFASGQPLIERVVTVAGPGVERPGNYLVPLGTAVRDVLEHCGLSRDTRQVIMGGPMMGQPLASLDVPVVKGTSGLLAFTEQVIEHDTEYACIRCGQCLEACGNNLNPSRLARLSQSERWAELEQAFVMDCMECGACSYTCPSRIPIVHLIRAAKASLRKRPAEDS